MGDKGAKLTPAATQEADALLADLAPLNEPLHHRKMFGGYGIFADDTMFGLVDSTGRPHLKVDETTQPEYEAAGATRHGRMPYWSIPSQVRADEAALIQWARRAVSAARRARQ
ncbi:TfoX/Sxy family protein [Mycobacterium spongiae]|uniref:Competence protein TfoX n=1 Tax=Mycobacterium spongiae TaxID=886343 RepID=A0A975JVC5_9MYCO|nr:TfoX/Sxy family protein [Mycobacterium spongiae]QUR65809.1 competence protein TfoX [Mycobacterium spongiae]